MPTEIEYRMSRPALWGATVLSLIAVAVVASAALTSHAAPLVGVTVSPGDSLWVIAQRLAPDADTGLLVDQIRVANHLSSDQVVPGQELMVPLPDS